MRWVLTLEVLTDGSTTVVALADLTIDAEPFDRPFRNRYEFGPTLVRCSPREHRWSDDCF
jgi:hypothetical protein